VSDGALKLWKHKSLRSGQ